jgi:hypothetical protein
MNGREAEASMVYTRKRSALRSVVLYMFMPPRFSDGGYKRGDECIEVSPLGSPRIRYRARIQQSADQE